MLLILHSTAILWRSLAHNDELGPKSTHARVRDSVAEKPTANATDYGSPIENRVAAPAAAHTNPHQAHEAV
jgi:hypothetical protein